jgi:hypothetical protein
MRRLRLLVFGLALGGVQESRAGLYFQSVPGPTGAETNYLAADGSTL